MYRLKFARKQVTITIAKDGVEALKSALKNQPKLLLLDLRIPIIDGVEVLQKLRRYEWGKHMKVIILSNLNESEAPKQLKQLGYDRYVVKAHTTPGKIVRMVQEFSY